MDKDVSVRVFWEADIQVNQSLQEEIQVKDESGGAEVGEQALKLRRWSAICEEMEGEKGRGEPQTVAQL